jgi:hypothetical protein
MGGLIPLQNRKGNSMSGWDDAAKDYNKSGSTTASSSSSLKGSNGTDPWDNAAKEYHGTSADAQPHDDSLLSGATSISPDHGGLRSWLDRAENDLRYGGRSTWLGEAAHDIGLPGINTGVSEGAANLIGGSVLAPIHAVGAGHELVTGHPVRALNKTVQTVGDLALPLAAAAPEALPLMAPRIGGAYAGAKLGSALADKAGVTDPDYKELASNVGGTVGAGPDVIPDVYRGARDLELPGKAGDIAESITGSRRLGGIASKPLRVMARSPKTTATVLAGGVTAATGIPHAVPIVAGEGLLAITGGHTNLGRSIELPESWRNVGLTEDEAGTERFDKDVSESKKVYEQAAKDAAPYHDLDPRDWGTEGKEAIEAEKNAKSNYADNLFKSKARAVDAPGRVATYRDASGHFVKGLGDYLNNLEDKDFVFDRTGKDLGRIDKAHSELKRLGILGPDSLPFNPPIEESAVPKTAVWRDATNQNEPFAGEEIPDVNGAPVWRDATHLNKIPFAGEELPDVERPASEAKSYAGPIPNIEEAPASVAPKDHLEDLLNAATDAKVPKPNTPLRSGELIAPEEAEHLGQHARANGKWINDLPAPERSKIHNLTNVEVRQLAINLGEDMGQSVVGRSKSSGSVPREEVFNNLLKRVSAKDIAKAIDEGKQLPPKESGLGEKLKGLHENEEGSFNIPEFLNIGKRVRGLFGKATGSPSDLDATANNYLDSLGNPKIPRIEDVRGESDAGGLNIGGRTSGAAAQRNFIPTIEANKAAEDFLGKAYADKNSRVLPEIGKPTALSSDELNKTASNFIDTIPGANDLKLTKGTPPSEAELARLKTRAGATLEYAEQPGELINRHKVNIYGPKGDLQGEITATSEPGENVWTIRSSRSELGNQTGRDAYQRLFEEARKQAQKTGKPITVRSDVSVSDSAYATWQGLERTRGYAIKMGKRPEVTFTPNERAVDTSESLPEVKSTMKSIHDIVDNHLKRNQ